jgi:hypothetical protein
MRRAVLCFALFALLSAVFATGAPAAIYTITLTNGTTFDSRYQPEYASWDPQKVMILSEFGNQLAFPVSEIQTVTVDTETKGFGHQINTTTVAFGWAPNDLIDPNSDEGKAALAAQAQAAAAQGSMGAVYTQQQFVEPSQLTGIPTWMTGINAVPQTAPPPPPPNQ